jgi:signal transduction histidine kinase/ActR/RegA family two-component response regulator
VDLHGRPLRLRASGRLVTDASGVAVGTEWFVEDVSERRDLEQRLLHIQKMDAVGRLAGGVAHDFNNLLTVIIGYAAALRERLHAAADVAEIDEIRRAADRAQALTAQLLQFSRRQLMAPRVVDVNTIVSDSRRMLERVIGEQITVAVELVGEPALIRADPAQVEQVVVNLALNARDAMPRGGRLHITTGLRTIREPGRSPAHAPPGEYVVLQVSDTGTGMDAATVERIFEPFFTTKDLGRGTGLGLSTVYGIVQQSGGAIAVQSEPGAGSTFIVLFPRVDGAVDDARSASAAVALTGRGETILLVEDDNAVRALVRRFLGDRGYRVLTAAGGREAIELAAGFSGPIDLLLTDVVLPDLSPPEIRAELERTRPRMPTILMSGYATEVLSRHGGVPDGAAFIAKPFDPADLLALIRHTLQARN